MSTVSHKQQQPRALSREELAICEEWADTECDRKRPHNRAAYRAVILLRVQAEMASAPTLPIAAAPSETPHSEPVQLDDAPDDPTWFADALVARQALAAGLEEGRTDRARQLAMMELEQCLPTWGRR